MNRYFNQLLQSYLKDKSKNKNKVWKFIAENDTSLLNFFSVYRLLKSFKNNQLDRNDKYKILSEISDFKCDKCQGRGLVINKFFNNILNEFKKIVKNRPHAIPEYDQAFIKDEDVIKRVAFIHERGDLLNSKILVIGDDDLISIALGLTRLPKIIYILEIDERLINFINKVSNNFNLKIKALSYNVCYPLSGNLLNKFDIFITDPVETTTGLKAFLLRGMLSLSKNGSGYFGLTTLESGLTKWQEIEKFIINSGFVITDIRRNFSVYPIINYELSWGSFENKLPIYKKIKKKSNYNWYYSSFVRIEKIKDIKLKNYKINFDKNFYRDKEALATPYF